MHEQPSSKPSNFVLFVLLSLGVLMLHSMWFGNRDPQPDKKKPAAAAKAQPDQKEKQEPGDQQQPVKPDERAPEEEPEEEPPQGADPIDQPPVDGQRVPKAAEPSWYTLGSADTDDPYRMLVTLTDRGAAVARIELNSRRYPELMDDDAYLDPDHPGYLAYTGGYLGRVTIDKDKQGKGCLVQVVGHGTPAAKAGLVPGDLITAVDGKPVTGGKKLHEILAKKKPRRDVKLSVLRDGKELTLTATLTRPPMEVIRPEGDDPLSFLMTLSRIDKKKLPDLEIDENEPKDKRPVYVDKELKGLNLRGGTWEVVNPSQKEITFRCRLPRWGLELVKTYRLEPVPEDKQQDNDCKAYHLFLDVKIRNVGQANRTVAYQLDGPTGLPIEGWWYANKVGYAWGAGIRDVVVSFEQNTPKMVACKTIADDKLEGAWSDQSITYVGVDAQYFSAILIPDKKSPDDIWFAEAAPLRVGPVDEKIPRITDVSCRVRSKPKTLEPGGAPLAHSYTIFAGPKRSDILTHYGLDELVYYGWFDIFARPMVAILHFFHGIVLNYGLAILMLTVLVRGAMYPMSRKQVRGMQKMAELQPEIKKLQEKHKKDLEARTKAQRELFKKHNYNPLSGCLVMFVQLPIFIGLYRALMVDVELRGSPLLWSGFRWCSNLSAPDMLFDWHNLLPEYFTYGIGVFKLGPYFNLLPIATVILFLLQQKMFMPPPADEQQAMQQKIMKYMMLFMGVLFFKIASGLCVYFIASSLWGLAERKLLPKTPHKKPDAKPAEPPPAKKKPVAGDNGAAKRKKRKKSGRRK